MTFTVYAAACAIFILVCLGVLWPIHTASRRVERQNRQLQRELNLDGARGKNE